METQRTIDDIPKELVEIFGEDAMALLLEGAPEDMNLQQFATFLDWLTVLMLAGTRHALPNLTGKEAVNLLEIVARKIANPGFKHRWDWARRWMRQMGMKATIAKIRIEFDRTLHGDKA
jgi:hypothetical protein